MRGQRKLILYLLLASMFLLLPLTPSPNTQTRTSSATSTLTLPTMPVRLGFWDFGKWLSSLTRHWFWQFGSFTGGLKPNIVSVYAQPVLDKSCSGSGTLKVDSACTIASTASAALVIANITAVGTTAPSGVTIGGSVATLLDSATDGTYAVTAAYCLYLASTGGSVAVVPTYAVNTRAVLTAATFTNTATATPWFEGTAHNSGAGASPQSATCTTTGSTANTLSYIGVGGAQEAAAATSITIAPPTNWSEIIESDLAGTVSKIGVSTENSDYATTAGVFTSTLTNVGSSIGWANVCTRILVGAASYPKTLSDTVIQADSLSKNASKKLSETGNLLDQVFKGQSSTNVDALNLVDALSKLRDAPKPITDTLTLTDSLLKGSATKLSDTLSLVDSLIGLRNAPKSLSDTLTLTDSLMKGIGKFFTNSNGESLAFAEVIRLGISKPLLDVLSVVESLTAQQSGGIQNYPRSLTDISQLVDGLFMHVTSLRALLDSFSLVDVLASRLLAQRNLAEIVSMSDLLARKVVLQRTVSGILSLSDSINVHLDFTKLISDARF